VASYLHEAEVGFLLRKDTIVNRVCFPTKLGEYLASGCWVVSSDIDWDVKEWFQKYKIGLLAKPDSPASEIATAIITYRLGVQSGQIRNDILQASNEMDRNFWVENLKMKIKEFLPATKNL